MGPRVEAHISTKSGLFYKEEGPNESWTCGQECSLCHDGYPGPHLPHTSAEMSAVLALDVQRTKAHAVCALQPYSMGPSSPAGGAVYICCCSGWQRLRSGPGRPP